MNVNESFILQKVENVLKEVVGSVVDSSKAGWLDAIIDKALCDNLDVENLFSSKLLKDVVIKAQVTKNKTAEVFDSFSR